jgi:transcriptional regulator with XRE-family HTH domain
MDLSTPEGRREQGQRLQRAIIEAGYDSFSAFAEKLGCSRALIYQYVNGTVLAQPDRVQAISRLTGKPLEWFYAEDPDALTRQTDDLRSTVEELNRQTAALQAELGRMRDSASVQAEQQRAEVLALAAELAYACREGRDPRALLEASQRWRELARAAGDERQGAAAWAQIDLTRGEKEVSGAEPV